MPRRPLPLERLPPDILPPDFLARHDLLRRLRPDPDQGLTPPHPWAPMTDAEWDLLRPHLPGTTAGGPGRPTDARARLDAIFRAVTLKRAAPLASTGPPPAAGPAAQRAPWSALPAAFGRPDSVARLFRRWARQGLWARLLCLVAEREARGDPLRLGLRWRVCCAFRRAIRLMGGLRAILLARRLGLMSALRAPPAHLPDPDLSEIFQGVIRTTLDRMLSTPGWRPPHRVWSIFRGLLRFAGGRARLPLRLEPA